MVGSPKCCVLLGKFPFVFAATRVSAILDLNSNGMSDVWEQLRNAVGIDPNLDSDGDGFSNALEALAGTDPFNSNSVLRITSLDTDSQLLVWDSATNVNYQVLSTTNLNLPFAPLSPVIPSGGSSTFYLDTSPDPTNKFYRIQVVP